LLPNDFVRVRKGRDTPAALGDKLATVVKTDALSVWVEHKGLTYVLDRSQVRRVVPDQKDHNHA
jgi:hypothetical protein